jgi:hypothetical protein
VPTPEYSTDKLNPDDCWVGAGFDVSLNFLDRGWAERPRPPPAGVIEARDDPRNRRIDAWRHDDRDSARACFGCLQRLERAGNHINPEPFELGGLGRHQFGFAVGVVRLDYELCPSA